jgi:hypothetical protein
MGFPMLRTALVLLALVAPLSLVPAAGAEDWFISTCSAQGQFRAACSFTCIPGAKLLLSAGAYADTPSFVVATAECGGATVACEEEAVSLPSGAQCDEMSLVLSAIAASGECVATGFNHVSVYCASST